MRHKRKKQLKAKRTVRKTARKRIVARVKRKQQSLSLRGVLYQDFRSLALDCKQIYNAFYTVYMSDAP